MQTISPEFSFPQPPADILGDASAIVDFYREAWTKNIKDYADLSSDFLAIGRERDTWREKAVELEGKLQMLVAKLQAIFSDLRQILGRNSQNSSMPPSQDTFYGKVSLDKLLKTHGLDDFLKKPEEASESDGQAEKTGKEQSEGTDDQGQDAQSEDTSAKTAKTDTEDGAKPEQESEKTSKSGGSKNEKTRKAHHPGVSQQMLEPDKVVECPPTKCPKCGCTEFIDVTDEYIQQLIDVIDQLVEVTHYNVQSGTCANCGERVTGTVPEEAKDMAYGIYFHALVAWLICVAAVSRRQLEEFVRKVLGKPISQGAIDNIIKRVARAIKVYYDRIAELARSADINYMDETGFPLFGPPGALLHWLWGMFNRKVIFFKVHAHRSKAAFMIVIGPWRGVLVSDDYSTYIKWENGRQTCLAHLIRAARKASESNYPRIAECGSWLLRKLQEYCKKKGNQMSPEEVAALKAEFLKEAKDYYGVGGEVGKLLKRIIEEFDAVTYFMTHPGVDPTNNYAERCLRPYVVARKKSFGVTSEDGEAWLERSLSLRMTCDLHGVSFYDVLVEAMKCYYDGTKPNMDWMNEEVSA